METITIRGKNFNKEEVEKRGATKIKIISNVMRWLGLTIFLMGFVPLIPLFFPASEESDVTIAVVYGVIYIYLIIFLFAPHMLAGLILFCGSFKRRNALIYGVKDIEQELPEVDRTVVVQLSNAQEFRQSDKFDEIKQYKELLDQGIISQEEFDDKKRELLG